MALKPPSSSGVRPLSLGQRFANMFGRGTPQSGVANPTPVSGIAGAQSAYGQPRPSTPTHDATGFLQLPAVARVKSETLSQVLEQPPLMRSVVIGERPENEEACVKIDVAYVNHLEQMGMPPPGEREPLTADQMSEMAKLIAERLTNNFAQIRPGIDHQSAQLFHTMAARNKVSFERVAIEYIANGVLFAILRDYYSLDDATRFAQSRADGLIAYTHNGSIVSMPPESATGLRTYDYIRMPSRTRDNIESQHCEGTLAAEAHIGGSMYLTGDVHRTSPIRMMAAVPMSRSAIFESVSESFATGSSNVSQILDLADIQALMAARDNT
jgi:hypothetical protein